MENKAKEVNRNAKIANIQFVLSILIVMIHANSVFINLPGSQTQYVYGTNWASFVQLFFSEGIARIAVPTFFIISAYLFFNSFDGSLKVYAKKIKKRFFSLVIPYLFWSAFTFFAFFIAQKIPGVKEYFTTRNEESLSIKVLFDNIIVSSYNSPLWFVRYLIVFSLLSIVLYYAVKKVPYVFTIIAFIGWVFGFFGLPINLGVRWDAVFFYLLGVEIALKKESFSKISNVLNKKWILILTSCAYVILQIIRTVLLCDKNPSYLLNGEYDALLHYLSSFGILLGIFALWFGWDYVFKTKENKEWAVSSFSFFLFVTHHPVVNVVKKLMFKLIGVSVFTSFLVYLLAIAITTLLILFVGWLAKRYIGKVFNFVCGGR